MEKPFTLKIKETEQKIVKIINDSSIPAFCLKSILKSLYEEIEKIDEKEIEEYKKEQIEKERNDEDCKK